MDRDHPSDQEASLDEFRQIVEHSSDGMMLTDEHGGILVWNQAMVDISGISEAEALGLPVWEIQTRLSARPVKDEEFTESLRKAAEDALTKGQIQQAGYLESTSISDGSGTAHILQIRTSTIKTAKGFRLVSIIRDVTDKRITDERLENLARFPAENPHPVMRISKSGQILFANEPSRPILEEWNAGMGELVPRDWTGLVREALSSGKKKEFDQHIRDQIFSVTLIPFRDYGYANLYWVDETHRIQAEISLRERENELASLYEVMPVGVCMSDEEGRFVYVNDMYCRMYGYSRTELIDHHFKMILPAEDMEIGLSTHTGLLRGQTNLLPTLRRRLKKDGTPFIVEAYNATLTRANGKRLLITVVNDVTRRVAIEETQRRSEELSRRLASRLEAIARVTRQISAIMDPPSLYQLIAASLQEVTDCYAANLILVEEGSAYRVASVCSNPGAPINDGFAQPLESGVIGRAARSGQTQLVPDVTLDEDYFEGPGMAGVRSEMAVPIKAGSRVLGVLDVQFNRPDSIDPADAEALGILADQLAITFENSRLFEETRRRASDLEGLVKASAALRSTQSRAAVIPVILEESMKLLNSSGAALMLLYPDTQILQIEQASGSWVSLSGEQIGSNQGINRNVLESGQLFIENNADAEGTFPWPELVPPAKCVAFAPLIVSGQAIGVLALGRENAFTLFDASLINAISDMAAIAIHRETLHEQTIASLQRISALHTVDMAINASLDMHFTLNVLLEQLTSQLGVHGATVLLFNPKTLTLDHGAARGFNNLAVTRVHIHMGDQLAGLVALKRVQIRVPSPTGATSHLIPPSLAAEGFKTYFGIPLVAKGQIKGVLELLHRADYHMDSARIEFLETLADQAAIAIDNAELFNNLQVSNTELSLAYDATIEGWSKAMDLRDRETEGHTQRVTEITMRLGRMMGMSDEEVMYLRRGALLHDIGKMGIPDNILHKPGPLTEEEWEVMHRHPDYAYNLLSPISFLRPSVDIPYCHHEKWNGTGYPRRLKRRTDPPSGAHICSCGCMGCLALRPPLPAGLAGR